MLSNDITAHTTGRRHMAALAKAGNAQSVPKAATSEAEAKANPPIPPGMLPWTCTLCLTTMPSKDAAGHKNGKRHMAALAKAGNAHSVTTAATTEAEANPPIPPGRLPWTCTLCLITMPSKDAAGHRNGKRHISAMLKAGYAQSGLMTTTTATEVDSSSSPNKKPYYWTCTICHITMPLKDSTTHEKGKRHIKALAKIGIVQSGRTATPSALQTNFQNPEPSAPFADDWQPGEEPYEDLYQSSLCNANMFDSQDYSICDKDCGWCGECMENAYFFD